MKFSLWLTYTNPSEVVDLAQAAERIGFFGITMGEHVLHPVYVASDYAYKATPGGPRSIDQSIPLLNLWATAGAILGSTKHLHFMTAVCLLPLYHPSFRPTRPRHSPACPTIASHWVWGSVGCGRGDDELGVPVGRGAARGSLRRSTPSSGPGRRLGAYRGEHYSINPMGTNPLSPSQIPALGGSPKAGCDAPPIAAAAGSAPRRRT